MNTPQFGIFRFFYAASVAIAPVFVERAEVNEVRNPDTGEVRFVQTCLWDTYDGSCQHIRDWAMSDRTHVIPRGRGAVILWQHDCGRVSRVVAERLDVTQTWWDVEEGDRDVLPVDERCSVLR